MAASEKAGKSVLIIVENLPVPRDRRVWQEAKALTAAGYDVTVICPRTEAYPQRREVLEGITILRHPLPAEGEGLWGYLAEYSTALFWESVLAWRVLLGRGFDIVHACNPPETIFLVGLFFKIFFGKQFVFDHHDVSPELYEVKFGRKGPFHKLLLWLERATFASADISIATNESFRRVAITRGGMDPDKVFVVRSGPDLSRLRPVEPDPALKRGRRYLIGYLGVMNNQDGVDYILQAMRHIVHDLGRHDVQAALLGDGPELKKLKQQAQDMGIADYVTFTGWADHDVILPYLSTADVCIAPDPYNDFNDKCTMNKIVEYMAMGCPVVQFDLTEGRQSAGEAAVYAARNDAVDLARKTLDLLEDEPRRKAMGELGRQRIERELSWQHQVPKLLAAYASLDAVPAKRRVRAGG